MIVVGKYQCKSQIGWGEEADVYLGPDDPGRRFPLAVKVRHANSGGAARFLHAARGQQAIEAAGCRWVAPVLDVGEEGAQAYYVTRRFPRPLDKVIQGKVEINAEDLSHLAKSVLSALAELRDRHHRAHGNLKPSNIFLEGGGALRKTKVVLGDLAPDAGAERQGDDCHALGTALYQLIRRRAVQRIDWPMQYGPDWERLGPTGGGWLDFCNALMSPEMTGNLEALARAQQAFREIGQRRRVKAAPAAEPIRDAAPDAPEAPRPREAMRQWVWAAIAAALGLGGVTMTVYVGKSGKKVVVPTSIPTASSVLLSRAGAPSVLASAPVPKPSPPASVSATPTPTPTLEPSTADVAMNQSSTLPLSLEPLPSPAFSPPTPTADVAVKQQLKDYLGKLQNLQRTLEDLPKSTKPLDANEILRGFNKKPESNQSFIEDLEKELTKMGPYGDELIFEKSSIYNLGPPTKFSNAPQYYTVFCSGIEFTRVPAAGNTSAFYLGKTTMSVDLASKIITPSELGDKQGDLNAKLMGPTSWQIKSQLGSSKFTIDTKSWFLAHELGATGKPPSPSSPMNYISASQAVELAKRLGCRLPTKDEWINATNQSEWQNHREQWTKTRNKAWVDALNVWKDATGVNRTLKRIDQDAFYIDMSNNEAFGNDTDSDYAFFAPVNTNEHNGFCHLIGNVGQYATDESSNYYLVGGSSQASKRKFDELSLTPQHLNDPKKAYSDAGVRLAVSAKSTEAFNVLQKSLKEEIDKVEQKMAQASSVPPTQ